MLEKALEFLGIVGQEALGVFLHDPTTEAVVGLVSAADAGMAIIEGALEDEYSAGVLDERKRGAKRLRKANGQFKKALKQQRVAHKRKEQKIIELAAKEIERRTR